MGIQVVDNDIALSGLKMLDMFPAGLTANEVRILDLCNGKKYNRMQIMSAITGLSGIISNSIAYLIQKELLEANVGGYLTTKKGEKYLTIIEKEGFSWKDN